MMSGIPLPDPKAFETKVEWHQKSSEKKKRPYLCPRSPIKSPNLSSKVYKNASVYSPFAKSLLSDTETFTNKLSSLLNSAPTKVYREPMKVNYRDNLRHLNEETSHLETGIVNLFEKVYENFGVIGQGSFGTVYKVRSRVDGNMYAVKKSQLPFKGAKDRQLAISEVRKLNKITNRAGDQSLQDNCVRLLDAWEEQGYLYMLTEICERGDLKTYIQDLVDNNQLTEEEFWKLFLEACLGVKHLHHNGLLHLDIKPSNFMISSDLRVKLGDFGTALYLDEIVGTDISEGDCRYMAPELLAEAKITKAVDIFSLGVTMFEICGNIELPSGGPAWHALREGSALLPEGSVIYSQQIQDLLTHMLDPEAQNRPTIDEVISSTPQLSQLYQQHLSYINQTTSSTTTTTKSSAFTPSKPQHKRFNLDSITPSCLNFTTEKSFSSVTTATSEVKKRPVGNNLFSIKVTEDDQEDGGGSPKSCFKQLNFWELSPCDEKRAALVMTPDSCSPTREFSFDDGVGGGCGDIRAAANTPEVGETRAFRLFSFDGGDDGGCMDVDEEEEEEFRGNSPKMSTPFDCNAAKKNLMEFFNEA